MRLKKLNEADFQKQVIDLARIRGWLVAHFRPARVIRNGRETWATPVAGDGAGFPDLVLVRKGIALFRELKTDEGKLGISQKRWLEEIGLMADVWRPRDWARIERELL